MIACPAKLSAASIRYLDAALTGRGWSAHARHLDSIGDSTNEVALIGICGSHCSS